MGMYRKEWGCCNSVTETDAWEPEECPFCTPVRTKDLTDDEMEKAWGSKRDTHNWHQCVRAVIAADREKNK